MSETVSMPELKGTLLRKVARQHRSPSGRLAGHGTPQGLWRGETGSEARCAARTACVHLASPVRTCHWQLHEEVTVGFQWCEHGGLFFWLEMC